MSCAGTRTTSIYGCSSNIRPGFLHPTPFQTGCTNGLTTIIIEGEEDGAGDGGNRYLIPLHLKISVYSVCL
ncbi:hypothetical protein GYMLUDRAFT_50973 [Collybiopsis luxurians FD-317 M1]|uniref:Uncharacterized protein n=1 Tax=Collybiopsis luxurians FD-317 M1 TaxID=944289 RepID=A0A0D0BMZ6_9AGAR|nr:hypothetical protein GYMLUDRAFT_50973 [Collybiopsis luxurians FD-317 M1]